MHTKTDLTERLLARMKATGETPAQLARYLDIAPQTMTKLVRGARIAPDTRLAIIQRLDALESRARRAAGQRRRHARGETAESQTP
jgi:hypothetical protein